jgi:hypothetical protein
LFDFSATIALSGGPMLDATDETVVGLCFAGWPEDVHPKSKVGVVGR